MTTVFSQCALCTHLDEEAMTCAAFPDGIPEKILENDFDHRDPHEGDNGIQFEELPGAAEAAASFWSGWAS